VAGAGGGAGAGACWAAANAIINDSVDAMIAGAYDRMNIESSSQAVGFSPDRSSQAGRWWRDPSPLFEFADGFSRPTDALLSASPSTGCS
jgi:hypothetical protein